MWVDAADGETEAVDGGDPVDRGDGTTAGGAVSAGRAWSDLRHTHTTCQRDTARTDLSSQNQPA